MAGFDPPHRRDALFFANSYVIRSDQAVDFLGALATNDMILANLAGLHGNQVIVRRVIVQTIIAAAAARAFDITFWRRAAAQNADLNLDAGLTAVQFLAADGVTVNPGVHPGHFYYDSGDLFTPYVDEDALQQLHVGLVWRDAAAKVLGEPFVVIIWLDEGVE